MGAFLYGLLVAAGLLMIGLGYRAAVGRLRRNAWMGYRTAASLARDDVWYPTNRIAGRGIMITGALGIATSVTLFALKVQPELGALVGAAVLMVGSLTTAALAFAKERRIVESQANRR